MFKKKVVCHRLYYIRDYFDFSHDIARSEKRYVVASVKTYDNTGTYISLKLFKKENGDNEFRFNQKLTHSMQELEQVGENIDAIRRILSQSLRRSRAALTKESYSLVPVSKRMVKVVAANSKIKQASESDKEN